MLELALNEYSKEEVMKQLHLADGYREVKFRYDLLNKHEVKIGELTSLDGEITMNSLAEIKKVGRFNFKENELNDVDWLNDRVQPFFMLKMPKGDFIEWPLGIFLISSPTRAKRNSGIYREVEAYDASLVLMEDKFDNRYRIAAGTNYITAIKTILNQSNIWKINIPYIPSTISIDKEFEIGEEKITAINSLLQEINYTSLWVDNNGFFTAKPYIIPSSREVEYEYRNNNVSIIVSNSPTEELDLFNVPNKWIVTSSNPESVPLVSTYTNDLPTSPTSTANRGRTIVDFRTIDDIADQIILDEYTKRIAYESSNIYSKFNFQTAIMPHHSYLDCLFIEHTGFGVSHKFIETSWSMELKAGGKMNHTCRRIIRI